MIFERSSRLVEDEVGFYRDQMEQWKKDHIEAEFFHECEALVALSLFNFDRIIRFDQTVRVHFSKTRDAGLMKYLDSCEMVLKTWYEVSKYIELKVNGAEKLQFDVEGIEKFRDAMRQAKAICTPDDEYFTSPVLFEAGQQALEENRAGLTEAW